MFTACNKAAHFGVSGSGIADAANREVGSTDWARDAEKRSNDTKHLYPAGSWKCNLFVYDMLFNAGMKQPPLNEPKGWPFTAEAWKTAYHADFSNLGSSTSWQRGDIISNGTHCGIAVNGSEVVAACRKNVFRGVDEDLTGGVVRRYTGW